MIYVLDTNVWSDISRGVGRAGRKLSSTPQARVLIPALSIYELRRLPARSPAKQALERFIDQVLSNYEVAHVDRAAAEAAARLANVMAAKGRQIHHLDTLIAGIAIARNAVLVTRDKDFKGVASLRTESWA